MFGGAVATGSRETSTRLNSPLSLTYHHRLAYPAPTIDDISIAAAVVDLLISPAMAQPCPAYERCRPIFVTARVEVVGRGCPDLVSRIPVL